MRAVLVLLFVSASPILAAESSEPLHLDVIVEAGDYTRTDTPVSLELKHLTKPASKLQLLEHRNGKTVPIPFQIERGPKPRIWWIVSGLLPKNVLRYYELKQRTSASRSDNPVVKTEKNETGLKISIQGKPVLNYNAAHVKPPAGVDAKYGRSAHIHPIWTPGGQVVTDEHPTDHYHQSGLYLAYTKTEFEGRHPNFWDLLKGGARVRYAETLSTTSGPVFGGFSVRNEHVDQSLPGGNEKVALNENWNVRFFNVGGPKKGYWLGEIVSTRECASSSPLNILKYHYGGMAIRGARGWSKEHGSFLTSEGKTRIEGNHTRPVWVDMAGGKNDQWSGVTVFTHPKNFRFPEPVRLHPSMPYFVWTPAVLGPWSIEPGEKHVSRYTYLIHDGKPNPELANRIWNDIQHPPLVSSKPVSKK